MFFYVGLAFCILQRYLSSTTLCQSVTVSTTQIMSFIELVKAVKFSVTKKYLVRGKYTSEL